MTKIQKKTKPEATPLKPKKSRPTSKSQKSTPLYDPAERGQLLDLLAATHMGYVLITCDRPSPQGAIEVKLDFSNDPSLVSYLLEGALSHIENMEEEFPQEII